MRKQLSAAALILSEVEGCKRANQSHPSTSLRMSLFALLFGLFAFLPASAQQLHPLSPHPEGVEWPTRGWTYGEMPAETEALVQPLIDKAMAGEKPDVMGETRSIVIVHRGRIVAEAYREGFTKDTKQISWSVAKSITNSLVGRAVHLGLIDSIDDPMPGPWPEGDPRGEITWRHWLNMTEGLSNHELSPVPLHENLFVDMMFGAGKTDVAAFAAEHIVPEKPPGEEWKYSTAGYHMIGWALANKLGVDVVLEHLAEADPSDREREMVQNFERALSRTDKSEVEIAQSVAHFKEGLSHIESLPAQTKRGLVSSSGLMFLLHDVFGLDVVLEFDAAGTYLGGSNVWASAHDYAKFGYLYLRDGVWDGERLLPEGWVDFSRTETPPENSNTYGAGFWITTYGDEPTRAQAITSPPWDTFNANGSEGQSISIIPSRDLVIVRTGQMANNTENWNALFDWSQEIARAFPEVSLAPASAAVDLEAAE